MMCCLPSLGLCLTRYEVRLFWPERSASSGDANGRSLPKGGTSCCVLMAFTAGSPPGSLCHQVSSNIKKTHLPLGRAHVPLPSPKEIGDFLASHKAPGDHFAPVTLHDSFPSMFFKFCVRSDGLTGFPGNLRKYIWLLKPSGLSQQQLELIIAMQAFIYLIFFFSLNLLLIRCSNLPPTVLQCAKLI